MQKDRFIGTWTLLYAVFLVISAYVAYWNKLTLEEVALRYNKIILNFEVLIFISFCFRSGDSLPLCFLLDTLLPMLYYSSGYCMTLFFEMNLSICHLRTYEDNPVIVAKGILP